MVSRALANIRLVSMGAPLMDSQEQESVRTGQTLARIAEFSYLLIPKLAQKHSSRLPRWPFQCEAVLLPQLRCSTVLLQTPEMQAVII